MPETKPIERAVELVAFSTIVSKEWGGEVWWRGHGDCLWELTPGVYRGTSGPRREQNLYARFLQRARTRHSPCPSDDDIPGWLFLMQHYGTPTRLLDWTGSPLAATFFAAEDKPNKAGALFALNPFQLNKETVGSPHLPNAGHTIVNPLLNAVIQGGSADEEAVTAIIAPENNLRMTVQLSQFTIHGKRKSLGGVRDHPPYVKAAIIPQNAKKRLLAELQSLGISRSTLFPDLHNLSLELKETAFVERPSTGQDEHRNT